MLTKQIVACFDFDGWKLLQKDEFDQITTLFRAPDFEQLMRGAVSWGYLRQPIAIKIGEIANNF